MLLRVERRQLRRQVNSPKHSEPCADRIRKLRSIQAICLLGVLALGWKFREEVAGREVIAIRLLVALC